MSKDNLKAKTILTGEVEVKEDKIYIRSFFGLTERVIKKDEIANVHYNKLSRNTTIETTGGDKTEFSCWKPSKSKKILKAIR